MTVAEKIRNLRKRTGLSQEGMAARLEVSQSLISAWERGTNVPRLAEVIRLATACGVTADYLLREEDERTVEALAVELKVREVAGRIGWDAVYDRLMGIPAALPDLGGVAPLSRKGESITRQVRIETNMPQKRNPAPVDPPAEKPPKRRASGSRD